MIARIVWTILRYPVLGYHYAHGAFYVLFSEGNMVHMNRLDELAVSVKIKKEETKWMQQRK